MKRSLACLLAAVAAVFLFPTSQTVGSAGNVSFSGRGFVVSANVPALGINTTLVDTGPLPSSGGALQNSLLTVDIANLLTADVAHTTTIGQGDRSRSEASVADVNLTAGGNTVSADFLMARAMAVCTQSGPAVSGSSDIANLVINGQSITVSGQPNQTIALPLGEVIINEQTSAGSGDLTVNALHVSIPTVADVVISSAHSDVVCQGPPTCTGNDFVTGGGWIIAPDGSKGTFGVAGGNKNGLWGHLEYIDHGTGLNAHGTGVTKYMVKSTTCRHIEGTATINGADGFTYAVDACDNGDPGKGVDTFAISLSNGYQASGTLGGGNIQLHKPCQ